MKDYQFEDMDHLKICHQSPRLVLTLIIEAIFMVFFQMFWEDNLVLKCFLSYSFT